MADHTILDRKDRGEGQKLETGEEDGYIQHLGSEMVGAAPIIWWGGQSGRSKCFMLDWRLNIMAQYGTWRRRELAYNRRL